MGPESDLLTVILIAGVGIAFSAGAAIYDTAAIAFGVNILVWIPSAFILKSERFYDLTGSLTFLTTSIYSLFYRGATDDISIRKLVNSLCVIIWAVRLGSFLFTRICGDGGVDHRFDKYRNKPLAFLIPWMMQGLWVFLTALPVFVLDAAPSTRSSWAPSLNADLKGKNLITVLDVIGWTLWLFGWLIEVVADQQKRNWRALPSKPKPFIDVGLWSWSRHPNCWSMPCSCPPDSLYHRLWRNHSLVWPVSLIASYDAQRRIRRCHLANLRLHSAAIHLWRSPSRENKR